MIELYEKGLVISFLVYKFIFIFITTILFYFYIDGNLDVLLKTIFASVLFHMSIIFIFEMALLQNTIIAKKFVLKFLPSDFRKAIIQDMLHKRIVIYPELINLLSCPEDYIRMVSMYRGAADYISNKQTKLYVKLALGI